MGDTTNDDIRGTYALEDAQVVAARLVVAGACQSVEDCRFLFDILGLNNDDYTVDMNRSNVLIFPIVS